MIQRRQVIFHLSFGQYEEALELNEQMSFRLSYSPSFPLSLAPLTFPFSSASLTDIARRSAILKSLVQVVLRRTGLPSGMRTR